MSEKHSSKKRIAGGAATGSGINYQAAVTAITYVSMARGHSLSWLSKITEDIPVTVEAETGGSGDDIRLNLKTGDLVEVQVKKGLQKGSKLWEPLLGMAKAISNGKLNYGVLVVSPTSSGTIKSDLAKDITRLGDGRTDNLSAIAEDFRAKLNEMGLTVKNCCSRMRIQTVNALTDNNSHILATQSELGHICDGRKQTIAAWNSLYADATHLIEKRGRREMPSVLQILRADGVRLKADTKPIQILDQLCNWTHDVCEHFSILGSKNQLPVDKAWVPLRAVVQKAPEQYTDLSDAIDKYQSWATRSTSRDDDEVNPETLARFHTRVVLVGGPGMGKTTLLKRVARRYSEDLIPTLRLRLITVAARMREGFSFEESIFQLGLDGSGINIDAAKQAQFPNWLLLCDGLDECGKQQEAVASGISKFATGHPRCRAIVTTRPIGYDTAHFHDWRHYNILPLDDMSIKKNLATLATACKGDELPPTSKTYDLCSQELENDSIKKTISRTPLLLGIAASLIARGVRLGATKQSLYDRIFKLIDEAPNSRTPVPPRPSALLRHFLNILGWRIISNPLSNTDEISSKCATELSRNMGTALLQAEMDAEACLQYWQDVGMIEKIGIDDEQTFVFIHKTFGEFAAARQLHSLSLEEQPKAISDIIKQTDWTEVIRFAALLGMGNSICRALINNAKNFDVFPNLTLALETLTLATPPVLHEEQATIVEEALKTVSSVKRPQALKAGKHLIELARRLPEELGPSLSHLLTHQQPWTFLVGWAATVAAGPKYYKLSELPDAMNHCLNSEGRKHRSSLSGVFRLGSSSQDILEDFIIDSATVLLHQDPSNSIKEAVKTILHSPELNYYGFARRAIKLLKETIGEEESKAYSQKIFKHDSTFLPDFNRYNKASREMFESICEALDVKPLKNHAHADKKPLLQLSAFVSASHLMSIEASDVYSWLTPHQKEATRETLLGFIGVSGLDEKELKKELQLATSYFQESDTHSLFEVTTSVDAPESNWETAPTLNLDSSKIEAALYHPSRWIVILATYLISNLLSGEELERAIQEHFNKGERHTLWAASKLTFELPYPKAVSLLSERLKKPLVKGCEYLFKQLVEVKHQWDTETDAILRNGLFSSVEIAQQAAEYAASVANPNTPSLLPIVKDAYIYWIEHEKPYPTGEKIAAIPPSPRADLLKAILKIEPISYKELKSQIKDQRSDVSDIAKSELIKGLQRDLVHRIEFLTDILEEDLPPTLIPQAVTKMAPFSKDEWPLCVNLLKSSNPKIRYNTMALLNGDHIPTSDVHMYAVEMTTDQEQEIRDRAYRILDDH